LKRKSSKKKLKSSRITPNKHLSQSIDETDEARKVNLRYGSRQYTALAPTEVPTGLNVPPQDDLKLKYVHGFNGHYSICRNNLLKRDEEIIFNVAGVITLHNVNDNTQRHFTEHTEDVTAVAIHPTLPLMATGQRDEKGIRLPKICIWNFETLELVQEIEGFHQCAIYHLAFSTNTGLLYSCAGDTECTLLVFDLNCKKKTMKPIFQYSPISKSEVFGLVLCENIGSNGTNGQLVDEFITYGMKHLKTWEVLDENNINVGEGKYRVHGHLIPTTSVGPKKTKTKVEKAFQTAISVPSWPCTYIVGANSGTIYLIQYHQVKKRFNAFDTACTCAVWTGDGFIATSLRGEWIKFMQVNTKKQFKPVMNGTMNEFEHILGTGSAHALNYDQESKQLYVGSHRSQIYQMDFDHDNDSNITGELILNGHSNEIWGLATHPTRPIFVTSAYDGLICCWDSETNLPIPNKTIETKERFTCMTFSNDGKLIAAGTASSKVYLIDFDTFDIVHKETIKKAYKNAPIEQVGCVCFNPKDSLLVVGHFNSSVYLFNVIQKGRKSYLTKFCKNNRCQKTSACTHLQFSEDGKLFKSLGRDYDIQYWSVDYHRHSVQQHTYLVDPDKVKFVGCPILAGWDTQGISQRGMDGTDINTCSVTRNTDLRMTSSPNADKPLLVCGDDFGKIWLHNYPAIDCNASKSFTGHSAFVVDVKWSYDDEKVISIGGGDQGVFVWDRQRLE